MQNGGACEKGIDKVRETLREVSQSLVLCVSSGTEASPSKINAGDLTIKNAVGGGVPTLIRKPRHPGQTEGRLLRRLQPTEFEHAELRHHHTQLGEDRRADVGAVL